MSARIRSGIAVDATLALADHGWTTPAKLALASWAERAKVLNQSGYARYDERTSTMLAETAELLIDRCVATSASSGTRPAMIRPTNDAASMSSRASARSGSMVRAELDRDHDAILTAAGRG